jgi:hypothetical protein
MKKGLLVLMMLLLTVPAFAVQMTVAEGDASNGVKLDLGGEVRFRGYDMANFWNFDDNTDTDDFSTYRLRTRFFTKVGVADNVSGFIRFSNQTWGDSVFTSETMAKPPESRNWNGQNSDGNVFVDNAYIDVNNFLGAPVDLRMGRQDVMYGSGFVVFTGMSDVASTAFYFDGIKASLRFSKAAKLDLLCLKDKENIRTDLGGNDDVDLNGLYFTANCPVMGGQQEAYVLNKTDNGHRSDGTTVDKDIWMGGLRLSRTYDSGLNYSAEGAYQWGDAYRDAITGKVLDQSAYGYKLEVGYAVPMDSVKLRPFIGYTSMSGDEKSGDNDFEGWDVFYGGWPQFGDLLSWVFVNGPGKFSTGYSQTTSVTGEDNYSNLNLATLGTDINVGKVKSSLSYTKLMIADNTTVNANLKQAEDYGDYYLFMITYPYNKYLSFTLDTGAIDPGDAFPDTNDDMAYEVFWETSVKF